ncbi:FAD-dependent oxidoreductase [Acidovorax cavernicola]|uniref:FAD-dependent oxidoreductase n=1 Tax=Acidovorax cavernicola TaxID=1675792 RepID=A0A9X8GWR3_9BURK|nr:FAD-dependent oxidoreductase [Acidovorax cavernicola]RIX83195.1 FAD-dependent oxidoreductase [Acidovorax cavernicola]
MNSTLINLTGSPASALNATYDREVDLLVVGAGAAGMGAALVAAIEGLEVLLCEASTQVGGTAATSAGTVWIPGNHQSRMAGYDDTVDAAREYLRALIGSNSRDDLRHAYLEHAPQVIDYLRQNSKVEFVPCGMHPDYQDLPGAAAMGRALAPKAFDGRTLGKAFARVRAPISEFLVLGGMMAGKEDLPRLIGRFRSLPNFLYSASLFLRYAADRIMGYSRGTRLLMGNALVARLFASLRDREVPILFETRLVDLLKEDGAVVGVALQTRERIERVRARHGVILATGGIAHDNAMRQAYLPSRVPTHSLACPSNQGDGLRLAQGAGGAIGDAPASSGGFWTPASVTRMRGKHWGGVFPHLSLDRAKPGLIAVNAAGRRFVNEAASYHDFVLAMFASNLQAPTVPAFLICEQRFVTRYGLGLVYPGVKASDLTKHEAEGYLFRASTLSELAEKIKVSASGLIQTVERYNVHAHKGEDPEFHKGSTTLNRFNGDPSCKPNPCLAPIEHGPFCAMAVWPAEIACSTGLLTDKHARVLDPRGRPVPGLYACGNDMSSIMDGTYPGPGTTLGPALVFSYLAVQHALKMRHTGTHERASKADPSGSRPTMSGMDSLENLKAHPNEAS